MLSRNMKMLSLSCLLFRCIYFIGLTVFSSITAAETYTFLNARRLMEYDNRKIVESEIHTFTVRSMIDCTRACSEETYCTSFQFFSGGPTCVTLSERFRGVTAKTIAAPGYQLFQTDKPLPRFGSGCELDVDCKTLLNSRCHQGACSCDIGYNLRGNTCRNVKGILNCLAGFAC
ncbi:uncharacterized protein LOC124283865 [Haliotis rubra]|uniref:uncharacterized protein LOC124283865 n=1 Tax=Haliotis rubra TaxID=36100 RepID=UPI001EE4F6EE|nr:uncharacterized protein LOC124283865 [Haliotis rubra]